MSIRYVRPGIQGELRDPFDSDELIVKSLLTVAAFVALADGQVHMVERQGAVHYIDGRQLAPTISRQRVAAFFDERAQRFENADAADLTIEGLRPMAALSLTSDVNKLAELVAAADRHIDRQEARALGLIRLMTTS